MNILFSHYAVIDREGFGRTFMLARELAKLNHQVILFTTQHAKTFVWPVMVEQREGVKIYAFPDIIPMNLRRTGFGFLSLLLRCIYVLKFSLDVVIGDNGHRPSSGWPCKLHRALKKSKYLAEWWDFFGKSGQYDSLTVSKKILKGWYDLATEVEDKKSADGVVVLSAAMKKRALDCGISDDKICIVNGGADTQNIRFHAANSFRKKYGIAENAFVLGFAGMNEGELLDSLEFVKTVKLLKTETPVMWFSTGGLLSESTKQKYNIEDELIEFGWLNYADYSEVLSCADVFLLLQRESVCNETRWPNKLGDYLAAGRVVITNKVGELRQLCEQYPSSIIPCNNSADDLNQKITELIAQKHLLLELGKVNRNLAETDFSWNTQAKKFEKFVLTLTS